MSHTNGYEDIDMVLARAQADVQGTREEIQRATETIRILQASHARTTRQLRSTERDLTRQQNTHRIYIYRQASMRRQLIAVYEAQARRLSKENDELYSAIAEVRVAWVDLKGEYDELRDQLDTLRLTQAGSSTVDNVTEAFKKQPIQTTPSTLAADRPQAISSTVAADMSFDNIKTTP